MVCVIQIIFERLEKMCERKTVLLDMDSYKLLKKIKFDTDRKYKEIVGEALRMYQERLGKKKENES